MPEEYTQNKQDNQGFQVQSTEPMQYNNHNQQQVQQGYNDPQSYQDYTPQQHPQPNQVNTPHEKQVFQQTQPLHTATNQQQMAMAVTPQHQSQQNTGPQEKSKPQKQLQSQTKSGGGFFVISAILIIILGALAGSLYYLNFMKDDNINNTKTNQTENTDNNNKNNNQTPVIDETKTGGPTTPATIHLKNHTPDKSKTEWLESHFRLASNGTALNSDNTCALQTVCGDSIDYDNDGLTNMEEYSYNTDPNAPDTDGDMIADGDKLYVYYTNPTVADSDIDGKNDGKEIFTCYNPIKMNVKYDENDLVNIEKNIILNPLHDVTKQGIENNQGTSEDIDKYGYIYETCQEEEVGEEAGESQETDADINTEDVTTDPSQE